MYHQALPAETKHFPAHLSRLADALDGADNVHTMRRLQVVPQELPLHPQDEVECRRCEVHCDKVVHPSACVERACPFLYSFVELGRTYVGCMQKVFNVEIDLALMLEAEERGEFGAVRANREPLPMCRVEVDSCYEGREDELGCVNPEFHELPLGEPSFRIFAQVRPTA